jgi:mono/diheme cytochrome c family protein
MDTFPVDPRSERQTAVIRAARRSLFAVSALLLAAGLAGAQTAAPAGDAQNGKRLYTGKTCEMCHGTSGEGTATGPKIVPSSISYADFVSQLRSPLDRMPTFPESSVSNAEAADVYAYVKSLGGSSAGAPQASAAVPAEGNAQNGAKIFVAYGCFECHGRMAQGAAATGPRLGPHPISIANMIKELRHPNEMPPYSDKTVSDAEIADIHAFLASLPEPPKPDSIPLLSKQ